MAHVLTVEGWAKLLAGVPYNGEAASAVLRLCSWLRTLSRWEASVLGTVDESYRDALLSLLDEDEARVISMSSFCDLARAMRLPHSARDSETSGKLEESVRAIVNEQMGDADGADWANFRLLDRPIP